ncbi:hypothetical protein M0Q28_05145 [Patescibacteria group bacterium]|jgi:hypothetical protein|nr:hypothetical protein [Patescibacteria group bacterium]
MRTNLMILAVCAIVTGCDGFGPAPGTAMMSDAGVMPVGDGGPERPRPTTDGGMEMPRETDSGTPLGEVPVSGSACDPDRDRETYDCALEGCDRAYLVCLGNSRWRCVPDTGAICEMPRPETDAGVPSVETDAGSPAVGTDAGTPVVDAGSPAPACLADTVQFCPLAADGCLRMRPCNPVTGTYDGECLTVFCPSTGADAGTAPVDAGTDAGPPPVVDAGSDAGTDAGSDAGTDAGSDAGTSALVTYEILFSVDSSVITRPIRDLELLEETADEGATHAVAVPVTCLNGGGLGAMVTEGGRSYYRCDVSRPAGARFAFVGRINFTDGTNWGTLSGWNRTDCNDVAGTTLIEPNTAGVSWIIRRPSGASLLPSTGYPLAENYRHITEDDATTRVVDVVCRHMLTFSAL